MNLQAMPTMEYIHMVLQVQPGAATYSTTPAHRFYLNLQKNPETHFFLFTFASNILKITEIVRFRPSELRNYVAMSEEANVSIARIRTTAAFEGGWLFIQRAMSLVSVSRPAPSRASQQQPVVSLITNRITILLIY